MLDALDQPCRRALMNLPHKNNYHQPWLQIAATPGTLRKYIAFDNINTTISERSSEHVLNCGAGVAIWLNPITSSTFFRKQKPFLLSKGHSYVTYIYIYINPIKSYSEVFRNSSNSFKLSLSTASFTLLLSDNIQVSQNIENLSLAYSSSLMFTKFAKYEVHQES